MDIQQYLLTNQQLIEETLELLLPERETPYSALAQAARYATLGGGKRIRPILALAAADIFQPSNPVFLKPACALELVHTYSLIHDDLPCMDNDDYRRGKPSLHKKFSEDIAVLTGDSLLTYAFEVLAKDPHLLAEQKVRLIALLADRSGGEGMVAGQVMDIHGEKNRSDLSSLQRTHRYKTGALINASIEFGAILAGAPLSAFAPLRAFSEEIGLAFQIVDDVLDKEFPNGKKTFSISSDEKNGKSTYVTLLGIDAAKEKADEALGSALGHLHQIEGNTSLLKELAKFIVRRSS